MPTNDPRLHGIPAVYHWAILSGFAASAGPARVKCGDAPSKKPFNEGELVSFIQSHMTSTITQRDVELLRAIFEKPATPISLTVHAQRLLQFARARMAFESVETMKQFDSFLRDYVGV